MVVRNAGFWIVVGCGKAVVGTNAKKTDYTARQ